MANITGLSSNTIFRGVQRNYRAYVWSGKDRMRKYDGEAWRNAGIAKSSFTPTATAGTTTTNKITGTYYYYVVPVNANHIVYGDRVVSGLPSSRSAAVSVTAGKVTVGNIPATHDDSQVTHWYIYRNKDGVFDTNLQDETQDFFYVGSTAIGNTSFTDQVADNSLSTLQLDFRTVIPPTFKYGAVYGDRLFGCGFDPITTGTATVNGGDDTLIDFSGVTLPDGVVGCFFQKDGDDKIYTIIARPSTTQIQLDASFSGALSSASYSIFRDQSEVWFSEFDDFESWGLEGELQRNRLRVGGAGARKKVTGIAALGGYCYVFTETEIYRIYGKGTDVLDVKITPDPIFAGIGCVSGDSIVTLDNTLYWMSLQGPVMFDGTGAPQRIGEKLGHDFITDVLNPSQLSLICGGTDGTDIFFGVPLSGETENNRIYRYDRGTGDWWQMDYVWPTLMMYDIDSNGKPALFWAQGKRLVQYDGGATNDGVASGDTSGTATGGSTTTLTDTGKAFNTTGSGLAECVIHIRKSTGVLRGRGRISSNTGTTITFAYFGSEGDQDSVVAGDTYTIGAVEWYWKTKTYAQEADALRSMTLDIHADITDDSSNSIHKTDYIENETALQAAAEEIPINEVGKIGDVNVGGREYAVKLESRGVDAQFGLRGVKVDIIPSREHK